jgi:para-nitrobenzyl esterase
VEFIYQHDWGYFGEDCLRLNIWTPAINDNKKRPVMVWIHGGGYTFGSSQELPSYDGENISKKGDIVYVSVNHRLNVLGFTDLSSFGEKYKLSVNVGMIDLVAALEWIRDNITNFGGDPENVTIFGQSGGGGKVSTLMSAPSAKGLFHRAVVQSGANPRFQKQDVTKRIGEALVEELDLKSSEIDSIQKIPYTTLVASYQTALKKVRDELTKEGNPPKGYGFGLSPTQDGEFLPYDFKDPRSLAISEDVPLMIGSTKNEFIASLWGNPPLKYAPADSIMRFIKKKYKDKADAYISAVKKAFPEDTDPTDLIDVDLLFRRGTVKHANLKSAHSKAPVFMYMFTWQSPVFDGSYKAIHCMELPFVFNNIHLCEEMTGGRKEAYKLAEKMSLAWINFARYGDPNHDDLPKWEPYTEENGNTMFFDNTCSIRHNHDKDLLELTEDGSTLW